MSLSGFHRLFGCFSLCGLLIAFAPAASAQTGDQGAAQTSQGQGSQATDPLKRPPSEKQKRENAKSLKQELTREYKNWLDQDVRWIITDEERSAFKQLSNDEERDNFIEAFWQRRDPTPDTAENEFKEEHYRRIAYANEHFAAGIPGWKTCSACSSPGSVEWSTASATSLWILNGAPSSPPDTKPLSAKPPMAVRDRCPSASWTPAS